MSRRPQWACRKKRPASRRVDALQISLQRPHFLCTEDGRKHDPPFSLELDTGIDRAPIGASGTPVCASASPILQEHCLDRTHGAQVERHLDIVDRSARQAKRIPSPTDLLEASGSIERERGHVVAEGREVDVVDHGGRTREIERGTEQAPADALTAPGGLQAHGESAAMGDRTNGRTSKIDAAHDLHTLTRDPGAAPGERVERALERFEREALGPVRIVRRERHEVASFLTGFLPMALQMRGKRIGVHLTQDLDHDLRHAGGSRLRGAEHAMREDLRMVWAPWLHLCFRQTRGEGHMSNIERVIASLLLTCACIACSEAPVPSAEAPPPSPVANDAAARLDAALAEISPADTMEQWGRSCAFCHASGNAGAPRLNDVAAWRERVAAGEDQLLRHTLEGLNAMPPLGYCMDCTEADFRALIRFMIPAELKTEETGA